MRNINLNNTDYVLSKKHDTLVLKKALPEGYCLSQERTKTTTSNKICGIESIIRDGRRDECIITRDATSKKPLMFSINLKKHNTRYSNLKIAGSYNAGAPSDVVISVTERNSSRDLFASQKNNLLKKIENDMNMYSNMTQKLLKKTLKFFK